MSKQVKSKERVADFGEVFTNEREVNAMLDLVKDETENIESTFLEPACGDGNFLIEVLRRKLKVVKERYEKKEEQYEKFSIIAISSIYGVELLQDNVNACIERLFNYWNEEYTVNCKNIQSDTCREACRYILSKNILCGDALTMLKNDGTPIIFAEWKLVRGSLLKRRDYELSKILEAEQMVDTEEYNLFNFDEDIEQATRESMDKPIKEYPLTDYRMVMKYE